MSNLNKWLYDPQGEVCYGQEIVYQKMADFIGADNPVEDWGMGTGWASHYFTNYKGIDGSPHPKVDVIADLINYTSTADNILLRQVLEHNYEWKKIIVNAVDSFQKKLCITIHTPITGTTNQIYTSPTDIPDISFKKEDILGHFKGFTVTEEFVPTGQFEYGLEWIIYVERI